MVSTRNFMENYSNKARDISTYQSGDLAKIDFAKELAIALDNSNRYLSNRKNIIEEADKRDKVRWEQIFAKERRNKGIKNLIVGGITLLVGTAAIVATGGSAIPLVVLAGKICGTGTVAYSVSNMTEAGQDVIYGSLGDNKTGAFNPIRDTVFLGNDKLYHGTGQIFTTGSSILIPIGKTNSIVKGGFQFLAGSAGAWVGGKVGYYGLKQLGFSEENARIGQVLFSIYAGYKASQIAGKFTLNKTFKLDESLSKIDTKIKENIVRVGIQGETIAKNIDNRPYLNPNSRPSFRKGVVEKVFESARGKDGYVRDPYTKEIIDWKPGQPRKGVWDMGHVSDQKYSDVHKLYVEGKMTPKEFRDWYNDPTNYRPELPHTNRSHILEGRP